MALEPDRPDSRTHTTHAIILALFAALATGIVLQSVPLRSANDRSRWSTVWSLVERGTYHIDEIDKVPGWRTIDKARHRRSESDQWRTYSTKPPLTPTLVAGVYYLVRKATGLTLFKHTRETTRIILLIINVLPMVVAMCLLSRLLLRHCEDPGAGVLVLTIACFGTLLTPFLTTFNNHTIAATGVLITIYFASRILIDGSRSTKHFALCGFFAMWTCCNELPAAMFGLLFFWLLFRVDRKKTLAAFIPAALVPLAGFFITNYAATGGWKPLYTYYGTDRYVYTVDGVPSYWTDPKGLDANAESPLVYLMHCVIGHHGILSLTPVFLLSVIGIFSRKSWKHPVRPFLLPSALLTVGVLCFYLTRTKNYNYGGTSAGLRWAFWLIPFWIVALTPVVDRWWRRARTRTAVLVLFFGSTVSAATAIGNPWGHPWLYKYMKSQGLVRYSVAPPRLDRQLQSWLFTAPAVGPGELVTVTYKTDRIPAEKFSLAVARHGEELRLTIDAPSQGVPDYETSVDLEALEKGEEPNSYLRSAGGDPVIHASAIRFLNGLPAATEFSPRHVRYLQTPLQTDAVKCVQASATVFQSGPDGRRHRCDVWVSEEVPFGTVRVQTTVVDNRTGGILDCKTWTIAAIQRTSIPAVRE